MKEYITFDDVLIKPKFSTIKSRKDIDLSCILGDVTLQLPIISANMDTISGVGMAVAMGKAGGIGALHRFKSVDDNKIMFNASRAADVSVAVSIGVGSAEQDRAIQLYNVGARLFVLDVAHGAQSQVVEQYEWMKENYPKTFIVVGNFASVESVRDFMEKLDCRYKLDAVKVGIGPGSACTTRIKTGVGVPQLSAILEVAELCHSNNIKVIADGGMKTSGDIAKALAAGADMVMLGGMLSGTDESEGDLVERSNKWFKRYRGSASKDSYEDQSKDQSYITTEGESFLVEYKGSVNSVIKDIEGGLRSAFSYVGASNIQEFQSKAELIKVSANAVRESQAHGKKL